MSDMLDMLDMEPKKPQETLLTVFPVIAETQICASLLAERDCA